MPLGNNVEKNIEELYADNKKSGKARGNNGKPRSRKQIIAIAENAARKERKIGGMTRAERAVENGGAHYVKSKHI